MTFEVLFELNITPNESTATWAPVGEGIKSVTFANNEAKDQTPYLNGKGAKTTTVTSFQKSLAFTGDRAPGDAAQDYIVSKEFSMGNGRKSQFRQTDPDGRIVTGPITLTDIVSGGGDAANKSAFSFGVDFNGLPAVTPTKAATAATATFAAGSAIGTTAATVTAAVGNLLYYSIGAAAVVANDRQYVDEAQLVSYVSGADIAVAADKYVSIYEVDTYGHLVKFLSHKLITSEIKAA